MCFPSKNQRRGGRSQKAAARTTFQQKELRDHTTKKHGTSSRSTSDHSETDQSSTSNETCARLSLTKGRDQHPKVSAGTSDSELQSGVFDGNIHESYVLKAESGDQGSYGLALRPLADKRPTRGSKVTPEATPPTFSQTGSTVASCSHNHSRRPYARIPHDALKFDSVVGEGAFGRTWVGKWRHNQVAIKEVQPRVLLNESWDAIGDIAEQVGGMFYTRLFEIAPAVRELFPTDMKQQQRKLMNLLGAAVGSLRDLPSILGKVQALGRAHVHYGVEPEMYDAVATALLETLEKGLGDAWTIEVKAAWVNAYTLVAGVMKDAMADELRQQREPTSIDASSPSGPPLIFGPQLSLLKRHISKLQPVSKQATERFYSTLFETHPEFHELFPTSFVRRRGKVIKMLATVISAYPNETASVIERLHELGQIHGDLKVTAAMMEPTRVALFRTLEVELGPDEWTVDAMNAWSVAFDYCKYHMADKMPKERGGGSAAADESSDALISEADIKRVQETWGKVVPPTNLGQSTSDIHTTASTVGSRALQDLLQEAELLLDLPWHANVTQSIGICERPLLVIMEYCDGGSLEALLQSEVADKISIHEKVRFLRDIALGCDHLAHHGIIHKDLAARNILLVSRGASWTCKVADFGLSRRAEGSLAEQAFGDDKTETQLAVYVAAAAGGPLKHLAPEIYTSPHVFSTASDVWAYGVTSIELFSNGEPFPGVTAAEFGSCADEMLRLMALQLPPCMPASIAPFVATRIFEFDPRKRASFDDILNFLPDDAQS